MGYFSAGTVELIVSGADPTGESFYFLEMNTRLQVEHPVTEAITGIDLVEQMIRVAAGEALAFTQADVGINGWAIENRVYAEDPYRGFLPSTGRLVRYRTPLPLAGGAGGGPDPGADSDMPTPQPPPASGSGSYIRVDDGVTEGGEVSIFYDPMIAKLITWAPTREEAADLQIKALDRFEIEGLGHNIDFLSALMQHPRFRSGEITTGFIAEEYPDGFNGAPANAERLREVAAIAAGIEFTDQARQRRISGQLNGLGYPPCDWQVRIDGQNYAVVLGEGHAVVDGHRIEGHCDWLPGDRSASASGGPDNAELGLLVKRQAPYWRITTRGRSYKAMALPARLASHAAHMIEKVPPDTSKLLLCPMPGLLVKLHVGEGEAVEAGQPLATVEAMKMENILRAEKSGKIAKINATQGETLVVDAVILELE